MALARVDIHLDRAQDGWMDDQIDKLEEFAADAKERLVRLETRTEAMAANMATKADMARLDERIDGLAAVMRSEIARLDARIVTEFSRLDARIDSEIARVDARLSAAIAKLEATLVKWFVGTAVAMSGVIIAAVQLLR
jgi:hypothetical protein